MRTAKPYGWGDPTDPPRHMQWLHPRIAHNHGLGIIPAERGVERHQEGLFVGGQELAALIAGAAGAA